MKKIQQLCVLGCSSILLVACGGGGGSNASTNSGASTIPQPRPTEVGVTTVAQPSSTTQTNTAIQGNLIKLNGSNTGGSLHSSTLSTNDINNIVIDGKSIAIIPSNFSGNGSLNISSNNMARVTNTRNLSYTRYGYMREGVGASPYLVAQGQITTNMPNTGTAKYTGHAVHVQAGRTHQATAEFNVDYAKKTVTGKISPTNNATVELAGTINGNRFSGSKDGMTTTGAFYGPNAKELGGVYSNRAGTISGAYGASK